jgi:hypothetical protein
MRLSEYPTDIQDYVFQNNLQALVDFDENADYQEKVFDAVSGTLQIPFPPQADDLARLHRLIRERKCFTVLEFGVGYSTSIIADALEKNEQDFHALHPRPAVRNHHLFQLFCVDASQDWLHMVSRDFPHHLKCRTHFHHSEVHIGTFQDRLCHYYDALPDIVPDFIYLDGPSAKDVQGSLTGLSFQCEERTVMSADLLRMESVFLPGTFILVDGRTNNARFLERNFQREFLVKHDPESDITTFELTEARLGKYNVLGSDFFA